MSSSASGSLRLFLSSSIPKFNAIRIRSDRLNDFPGQLTRHQSVDLGSRASNSSSRLCGKRRAIWVFFDLVILEIYYIHHTAVNAFSGLTAYVFCIMVVCMGKRKPTIHKAKKGILRMAWTECGLPSAINNAFMLKEPRRVSVWMGDMHETWNYVTCKNCLRVGEARRKNK